MLVIEQLILPHAHSHPAHADLALHTVKEDTNCPRSTIEFDADVDLERDEGPLTGCPQADIPVPNILHDGADATRAFTLTFGLVVHGLADGLALGVSSLTTDALGSGSRLSLIVFLVLMIHKGQTTSPRLD